MKYAFVIEQSENNYSAYPLDLPGVGATGKTMDEVIQNIQEAIEFHLEGMRLHGDPIPEPNSKLEYVTVN